MEFIWLYVINLEEYSREQRLSKLELQATQQMKC